MTHVNTLSVSTNTYRIISTLDGSTKTCSLSELSLKLKPNCILCELNTDGTLIDSWPLVHETLVTFAVEFSDYALLNYSKKKLPKAEAYIALTRKWLENHDSISNEELRAAANAAGDAAAHAATTAAYAAAHAATTAAYAADAAAHAATTAAYAAYAVAYAAAAAAYAADAANAARAAARAAGKSREAELIRQGQFIVGYMRSSG